MRKHGFAHVCLHAIFDSAVGSNLRDDGVNHGLATLKFKISTLKRLQ